MSYTLSVEMAAITSYINKSHNSPLRLAKKLYQKSLVLHGCSISGLGREHVTIVFAPKASQYLICGYLQPIANEITKDARPKAVDAWVTLILSMG
jgi:hypothetical protein